METFGPKFLVTINNLKVHKFKCDLSPMHDIKSNQIVNS